VGKFEFYSYLFEVIVDEGDVHMTTIAKSCSVLKGHSLKIGLILLIPRVKSQLVDGGKMMQSRL
jgi:hypothetical protein